MKSKQITFFITSQDIPEINKFLKDKHCLILKRRTNQPRHNTDYDIVINNENIFQFYLCRKEYVSKIKYEYLEEKNYYYIDITESYCIEFNIGGFYPYSEQEFHRGRLYYIFEFYGSNNKIFRKDNEFITWAEDIIKDFKKHFLIREEPFPDLYLSKNSLEWIRLNKAELSGGGLKFISK